jgi:hypothetical protein
MNYEQWNYINIHIYPGRKDIKTNGGEFNQKKHQK